MCDSIAEGGRRCSDVSVYARQIRNIQARKQYYLRKAKDTRLSETLRQKNQEKADATVTALNNFRESHEWYGTPNMVPHEMKVSENVEKVINQLRADGMEPLIVGGSVRDSFLGLDSKDMDIEVYGAPVEQVIKSLRKLGKVDEVGKAFGVLKIRMGEDDLDVSLPRTDSKIGDGHRGFEIAVDHTMTPERAALRRDFTINAMMYDHHRRTLLDPYNGLEDMKRGVLRHVSEAFDEDPLRVLRGVQMASRFNMVLDPDTIERAKKLKKDFNDLASERVQMEWHKMFQKGKNTRRAFQTLKATGWDENFSGLAQINNENLWRNLQRVDNSSVKGDLKVSLMSAVCITGMNKKDAENFLHKTIIRDDTRAKARRLYEITPPAKQGKTEMKRWAQAIGTSTNIREWCQYQQFLGNKRTAEIIYKKAERWGILDRPEPDLLLGRDILEQHPEATPGKWMGALLKQARARQEEGVFTTREGALAWLGKNFPTDRPVR